MGNCLGHHSSGLEPIFNAEDDDNECEVALGQSQPLIHKVIIWESEIPLTNGQLQGKRDTFWETAPLYEGRKEIWDALKAAAEAAEEEDYDLAQAILTGANISLPKGILTESYDELGNRYIVPKYCLSKPINIQQLNQQESAPDTCIQRDYIGNPITLKIRLSTHSKDIKLTVSSSDSVLRVKQQLEEQYGVAANKITMLFSGKILPDSVVIGQLEIPKGFIIQAIVR